MLSQDDFKKLGLFDPTRIAGLREALNDTDSIAAAGAISLTTFHTKIAVVGTMAFTLANGTIAGQRKRISCESAATVPAATLTITTPDATAGYACSATFFFDTAGQEITLIWTGAAWRCIEVKRAGGAVNNVVVGTTVLTGLNLWKRYLLSVTGTVASTTTKGIPNGSAVGERICVGVSTAAAIPSGTISLAGVTPAGVAATTLGTVGLTSNFATLEWDGLAWNLVGNSVLVLS